MSRKYTLGKRYKRHSFRGLLIIVASSLLFSYWAYGPIRQPEVNAAPVIQPQLKVMAPQVTPGIPARLIIPKIKIEARITHVGLTDKGDMDSPSNIAEAGWYKHGPLVGNIGSAIIDGHRTGLNGEPGIFSDLDELQKGDLLSVIDDKGHTTHFIVREKRSYHKDEQVNEVFSNNDGAHLNLITCSGSWNKNDKSFEQRLVIFTDKSD